jgi:hypothetical protein
MFSSLDVRQRVQNDELEDFVADHFLCVTYQLDVSAWKYYNGKTWNNALSVVPSGVLVAEVRFHFQNVSLLGGIEQSASLHGIEKGFDGVRSDLDFVFPPNLQVAGSPLVGEAGFDTDKIRVLGRFFQPQSLTYGFTRTMGVNDGTAQVVCESVVMSTVSSDAKTLRIVLAPGTVLLKGATYTLWFFVSNPFSAQEAPTIELNIATDCITLNSVMNSPKTAALHVDSASFLSYKATQTSPFPCSSNIITFELMTNVYIRHENGATLYVSGFTGAIVGTEMLELTDASLNAMDHDDLWSSSGMWDDGTSTALWLDDSNNYARMAETGRLKIKQSRLLSRRHLDVSLSCLCDVETCRDIDTSLASVF